jgi:hypothetical protein
MMGRSISYDLKEEMKMLERMGKAVGVLTPFVSLLAIYQMWFVAKYVGSATTQYSGSASEVTVTETLTALQFALRYGSDAIIFWPICIFVLAVIGGVAAWFKKATIVWTLAIVLLIISVLGMWSIGSAVIPLAMLLSISAILLTLHKKKVNG